MMRTLACGKSGSVARSHHQPWFLGQIFNPLPWRCHLKRMGVKGHDDYAPLTLYYTHLVTRMSYVYGYIYIYTPSVEPEDYWLEWVSILEVRKSSTLLRLTDVEALLRACLRCFGIGR